MLTTHTRSGWAPNLLCLLTSDPNVEAESGGDVSAFTFLCLNGRSPLGCLHWYCTRPTAPSHTHTHTAWGHTNHSLSERQHHQLISKSPPLEVHFVQKSLNVCKSWRGSEERTKLVSSSVQKIFVVLRKAHDPDGWVNHWSGAEGFLTTNAYSYPNKTPEDKSD